MDTMKLTTDWDLDLDGSNNLATVDGREAIAQNVATTCLVWRGEYYWDTTFGVPYKNILGEQPPLSSLSAYLDECALTVDSVETVSIENKFLSINRVNHLLFHSTPMGRTIIHSI